LPSIEAFGTRHLLTRDGPARRRKIPYCMRKRRNAGADFRGG
jgi:hypothetical protein